MDFYNLGALACQIMDMLYPGNHIWKFNLLIGSIQMGKVNFAAKDMFEIQKNYRALQSAFSSRQLPYVRNI